MIRRGLVRDVKGDEALICPTDGNECNSCEARHACLSLSGGKKRKTDFWMPNDIGASQGDLVELELRSSASLTIIASTFLLPVFLLFAGYLFMMNGTDLQRALGAGAGLVAGIVAAIVINKRLGTKKGFNMQMTKILERAETDTAGRNTSGTKLEGNSDD
ncbi:MAG: SoxR reducing system RseC family protein [Candidatus Aegiribacteria sp.]|nr:SoxR reducing system RseC family protein [Candidatus Aegiribacteria sp.]